MAGSDERSYGPLEWFAAEINKAGGAVTFELLPGKRHREACDSAISSKRLKWMFSQEWAKSKFNANSKFSSSH